MRAAILSLALAVSASSTALAQTPGHADGVFQATTLNLSAYGEAPTAPDMATITLGVATEGKTAAEALSANAARMTQVIAALKRGGIAEKDIQTSNLNLNPQYRYVENQPPELTGYQAANQVAVTVRDLKRLGPALDAAVASGANQVNGIGFGLKDPTAAENTAREAAVKALAAKADLYARATGYRVARLVSITEAGGYAPPPPVPLASFAAQRAKAGATPVQAGELKVRVDISGVYELTR
jgi:uncharacterized protein YggE